MGVYFVHIRFRLWNLIIQDIPQEKYSPIHSIFYVSWNTNTENQGKYGLNIFVFNF